MENFKTNFLIRLGHSIGLVGYLYQSFGLKKTIRILYMDIQVKTFKLLYKRSKWFRNRVKSKLNISNPAVLMMFDQFFLDEKIDLNQCIDALEGEEKDEFIKGLKDARDEVIRKNNITDQKQIDSLNQAMGLKD